MMQPKRNGRPAKRTDRRISSAEPDDEAAGDRHGEREHEQRRGERHRRRAPSEEARRLKLREARGIVFAHPPVAAAFMTHKRGELTNPLLSVVMPVFNERETIERDRLAGSSPFRCASS